MTKIVNIKLLSERGMKMNIGEAQKLLEERGYFNAQKILKQIRNSKTNDLIHDVKKISDTFEPFSKVHLLVGFPECYQYILKGVKDTMDGKTVEYKSLRWVPEFRKIRDSAVVEFENFEWIPTVVGVVEESVVVFNHDTREWLKLRFSEESYLAPKTNRLLQFFLKEALKY